MDRILLYLYKQAFEGPFYLDLYNQFMAVLKEENAFLAKEMEEEQQASCQEPIEGMW